MCDGVGVLLLLLLQAIFKYYSLSEGRPTSNTQESLTVHCDSMLKFAVDFGIVPDVCTQQAFQV